MTKYSNEKASRFWSKRLTSTNPLSAVLTYNAPKALNEAYDLWEKEMLKSALPYNLKGKKALDIGTGIGRIALTLARLGTEVTAVDISEGMLTHLKRTARNEKLENRISVVQSSSADLPFKDQSFEIVTCFGLLEHLPEEVRRKTMHEAFRVMQPKGEMFIIVNNADCVFLENSYPMKSQRKDGYFVTLVGLQWLEKVCKVNHMKTNVIAANPLYALNHYFIASERKKYFGNEQNFSRFCRDSTKYDLLASLDNPGLNEMASHFLVRIS